MQLIRLAKFASFHILFIYTHAQCHGSKSVFSKLKSYAMKRLSFSFVFSQAGGQESAEENLYLLISENFP